MKRLGSLVALIVALQLAETGGAYAGPTAGDPVMAEAESAIAAKDYFRATRLLTALASRRNSPDSARAQELLGTVREANGQLAQARAEYEAYLAKYPEGEAAGRVRARLNALLGGGGSGPAESGMVTHGGVSLTYRSNEGGERPEAFLPEEDVISALTANIQLQTTINSAAGRTRLMFSGSGDLASDGIEDRDPKISEAFVEFRSKQMGATLTFGRFRPEPRGIAYRADGVSLVWPLGTGTKLGLVAGRPVVSTRDDLFGDDRTLYAVSATFGDSVVPGALSVYAVTQRDGSRTDRAALGVEYARDFDNGSSLFADAEYDVKYSVVSRAEIDGSIALDEDARLSGRLAYYRSPALSLENALYGQQGLTVDDLYLLYTSQQIDDFVRDSSSEVRTASLTYTDRLNAKWQYSVDASVFDIGSNPQTGSVILVPPPTPVTVSPVAGIGTRVYAGVSLFGSSVFRPGDNVNIALRYAKGEDDELYILDSSVFIPLSDRFSVRPRLRLGLRDNSGGGGNDTIFMPSVNARYRFDRGASLMVDIGTKHEERSEFFLTASISKSF